MIITSDKLKIILSQHPDLLSSHASLSSCLESLFAQQIAERRALVTAYDLGILSVLQKERNNHLVCNQFVSKMEQQYGIDPGLSRHAIMTWIDLYENYYA